MSEYRKLARLAARAIYKQTYALERKKASQHDDSSKQQSKAGLGRPSHFGRTQQEFPGLVEIVVDARAFWGSGARVRRGGAAGVRAAPSRRRSAHADCGPAVFWCLAPQPRAVARRALRAREFVEGL